MCKQVWMNIFKLIKISDIRCSGFVIQNNEIIIRRIPNIYRIWCGGGARYTRCPAEEAEHSGTSPDNIVNMILSHDFLSACTSCVIRYRLSLVCTIKLVVLVYISVQFTRNQGCRSRCFGVEPESFFWSGSGSCSYSSVNIYFYGTLRVS